MVLAVLLVGAVEGRLKGGSLWWRWARKTSWQWGLRLAFKCAKISVGREGGRLPEAEGDSESSVWVGLGLLAELGLLDPWEGSAL